MTEPRELREQYEKEMLFSPDWIGGEPKDHYKHWLESRLSEKKSGCACVIEGNEVKEYCKLHGQQISTLNENGGLKDEICPECGQGLVTHSCDTPPEGICLVCVAREDIDSLTRQLSKSRSEVERLMKICNRLPLTQRTYESELSRQESELTRLRSDLAEAYEVIGKRWYVQTEDGEKCFYCGEEVIDETEDYKPKHPSPSTCIVLKSRERQKEREGK